MLTTWLQNKSKLVTKSSASDFIARQSLLYLSKIVEVLDSKLDKRLTRTFQSLFIIIMLHRNPKMGLLLSELGGYLCGYDHAPAGTKRISNLLRNEDWSAEDIDNHFLERSKSRVESIVELGKRPLLIWDESRLEKHESQHLEGLCSVESSKGKRLTRIKPGFYDPYPKRICVPGFHWTGVLVAALGEVPSVCQMTWWTSRGEHKKDSKEVFEEMFGRIEKNIPHSCVHVMDRGYANSPTIGKLLGSGQQFVIRWIKNRLLVHQQKGTKKVCDLSRSFRGMGSKKVYDIQRKKCRSVSIAFTPVKHPDFSENELYLIIVRDKQKHQAPMYLLTSLSVTDAKTAWEVFYMYNYRWNIEQTFRCNKAELGMEAPRLWKWENRLKLLAIVALVYDFLLSLIRNWKGWVQQFFRQYVHRTGNRNRQATVPIYRLRAAISNCLCQPIWFSQQNSG